MEKEFVDAFLNWEKVKQGFVAKIPPDKVASYFQSEAAKPLGAQYKAQIAFLLARAQGGLKAGEFYKRLVKRAKANPNDAPRRRAGPAERADGALGDAYTYNTYYRWLSGNNPPSPWDADLHNLIDLIIDVSDEALEGKLLPGQSIRQLLCDYRGTAREALSDAVGLLAGMGKTRDWRRIEAHVHGVMPVETRRGLAPNSFKKHLKAVREALARVRSVQVTGPHYSGKNALLRQIVTEHRVSGFQIDSGSLLTICALSLHETSASEAIANIARFYRTALRVAPSGETVDELLGEIAHYSKQFPALIVISGVDAIDSDEIVRALHQDQLGEMVSRILAGHPETRLLVSSSSEERTQRSRLAEPSLDDRILTYRHIVDLTEPGIAANNYEYNAVRLCAEALCTSERSWERSEMIAEYGEAWVDEEHLKHRAVPVDATGKLAAFVSSTLLSRVERFYLGLVALSHDGLKPDTLAAIADSLRNELDPRLLPGDPRKVLDALPDAVVRKPAPASGTGPECYQIERALRDPLLTCWQADPDGEFRKACWGIARAAAREARRLRQNAGLEVSAGRDVQVLLFLLASVDPTAAGERGWGVPAEHIVLPPLGNAEAKIPAASTTLRFAYTTLFEGDLALSVEKGVQIFDARLRLAAVFPFLNNSRPWLPYAASVDRGDDWQPTLERSPWLQLDLTAQLRLLAFASAAAARLGLRQVISACSKIARDITIDKARATQEDLEPLIPLTDEQFEILSRICRYELDLGILLGRNPDARRKDGALLPSPLSGLAGVQERIDKLIDRIPRPDCAVGERELRLLSARKAEVLHLRGKHVEAHWMYRRALHLTVEGEGETFAEGGTLSGRSRRMFTRLLVELARGRLFDAIGSGAVTYSDGLTLPAFDRLTLEPWLMRKAERVVEESLRSLSHGTMNDWIGIKIDRARLAAVQIRYSDALELLDQAQHLVGASGASRDVLLEYLSVRGRTLADAAAFAMGAGARSPYEPGPSEDELKRLAAFYGLDFSSQTLLPWQRASLVSEALSLRALESLLILKKLVTLPETGETRYAIYADYLEVWIEVVRSRERVDSDDPLQIKAEVHAQLLGAAEKFQAVLGKMIRTGYLLSHREARLLAKALAGAGVQVAVPEGLPETSLARRFCQDPNYGEVRKDDREQG